MPDIYDASLETLVGIVAQLVDTLSWPVLVGHNPGIGELADWFLPAHERGTLQGGFPTAGLALFELSISSWHDLREGSGTLVAFLAPSHSM